MIQHRCCTPHCGFTAQKRTERLLVLNATFAFTRWQRDSPELTTGREKKKRREARRGKARRDETRHDEARQGKARRGEVKEGKRRNLGNTREKYSANTRAGSTSTEYNASRALRVGGVSRVYDRTRSSYIIAMEKGWRKRKRDEE